MQNPGYKRSRGVSLMDLMLTLVISTMLVAIAIPAYDGYAQRARVARAVSDIGTISIAIDRFRLRNRDRVPMSLDELGIDIPDDPWGNPYVFTNIIDAGPGFGGFRKDGNLNPINTDFDLYSMGRDGDSVGPLNAKKSRDDIVRANNGDFIGLAEDY